jgi:hypothetical protein
VPAFNLQPCLDEQLKILNKEVQTDVVGACKKAVKYVMFWGGQEKFISLGGKPTSPLSKAKPANSTPLPEA